MTRSFRIISLTLSCALLLAMSVVAGSAQTLPLNINTSQPIQHPIDRVHVVPSIIFLNTDGNASDSSIAVDSAGGVHIASSPMGAASDGTYPAYYAYCASNCANSANWSILQLEDLGFWGGFVRLALTSNGQPRMIWTRELTVGNGEYRYAECNSQCTNIANWTVGSTGPSFNADNSRYFALDNLNRPRLVYYDYNSGHKGMWYRFCNSTCTNSTNWYETNITTELLMRPSLVFTSSGQPRFIADYVGVSSRELRFYACDASCSYSANWYFVLLTSSNADNTFSLRLDHLDRPRLALYTGYRGLWDDNLLEYWWCDASCMDSNNWNGYTLGFDVYYGLDADLGFDSQNRPNLAFYVDTDPYGLVYSNCTTGCESFNSAWDYQFIETAADLSAIDPVPVKPGCSISSWFPGQKPSLALSSANQPYFVYDAQHVQGGTCQAETDINLARVALPGGAGGSYLLYLPFVKR
jgi:hypothetical protein